MPRCKDCSLFHPTSVDDLTSRIPASEHPGRCYLTPPVPIFIPAKGIVFVRPELREVEEGCHFHEPRQATIIPPKLAEDMN